MAVMLEGPLLVRWQHDLGSFYKVHARRVENDPVTRSGRGGAQLLTLSKGRNDVLHLSIPPA